MTRKEHIDTLAAETATKILHLTRAEWRNHPMIMQERVSVRKSGVGWNAGFVPEDNIILTAAPCKRLSCSVYTTLLHELGHANDKEMIARRFDSAILRIGDEIHAWKWAIAQHMNWTAACTIQLSAAIDSYTQNLRDDGFFRFLYGNVLDDVEALKALARNAETTTGSTLLPVAQAAA